MLLKTHQVQTLAINPECKRCFSKVYCSPTDNNAILTDFRGALGIWKKTAKQASYLAEIKKKKKVCELDSAVKVHSVFPF